MSEHPSAAWHGTTILSVRKDRQVVIAGDGQVSLQNTILKSGARKAMAIAAEICVYTNTHLTLEVIELPA